MTAANAATLAHLRELEAIAAKSLRIVALASQDGTLSDWMAARAASAPLCDAARVERERIARSGWGENGELEYAVRGYLGRCHSDPCIVRYSDLA